MASLISGSMIVRHRTVSAWLTYRTGQRSDDIIVDLCYLTFTSITDE